MKCSNLFNRLKAAVTCATMAATALVTPFFAQTETVDAAVDLNYAKALQYSLYLYDANMCGGQVGEKSQLDWRDDCHTYDSSVSTPYGTLDLSGGYHDAGDHAKFGLPAAYSATMLGWGYYEFESAFTKTGQAAHLQTITDYFCDYFKRCTVMSGSTVQAFCYQVGNGDTDHAQWCPPEDQTLARPAYFATSSNPCTDVVAETAAALAMNYLNFGNSEDLTYAKALYSFAKSNSKANHQSQSYYQGTSYLDDLALASIILYKATNTSSYKSDCANWISQSNWAYTSDYPLNWDSVWPAVNAIYANEWDRVAANLDTNKNGYNTSEGYACRNDWGSARYNTACQLVGLVYDKYKNTSTYTSWAKGQMEYLFGNNKLGNCYMVGYDSNSVTKPHHRAASGFDNFPSEYPGKAHENVLVGALVGGPDKSGNYVDDTDKYTYTEVAVDYNAAFVGALAGLYLEYGSGQSIASSVPGVSGQTTPNPTTTAPVTAVTTTTTTTIKVTDKPNTTTTTTNGNSSSNSNTINVNKTISVEEFVQVKLADLIPSGAKAEQFIVNFSANGNVGTPSMGGGVNVTSNEDYWLNIDGTISSSGSTGKATFDVKSIQNDLQVDEGIFQVGYWWGEQSQITIDSITCVCSGGSTATTTTTTTKPVTTTTTTIVTTTTTTTTTKPVTTTTTVKPQDGSETVNVNKTISVEEFVQVKLSDLIPNGAKAEKFIVNFSANGNVGTPSIGGGVNVTSNEDYWLNIDGTISSSGSTGKVTFDVKSIQNDLQVDEGIFQVGYWWGEQSQITINSIVCEYSMTSSNPSTTSTTKVTETSTTKPTTTTTKTTTTTSSSNENKLTVPSVSATKYGDTNLDGDINVADVVGLNMYLLNSNSNKLQNVGIANADCVRDGVITSADSALLMNYVSMMISESSLGK